MEQKPKSHKKKLILIISICVVLLAGLATAAAILVPEIIRHNSPQFTMSDSEFLVSSSPWYKLNDDASLSDKLIWNFNADGSGSITTNGGLNTYEMQWTLDGNHLQIKTAWLYDLTDDFSLTTDREQGSFTIVDTAEDKLTTFMPATTDTE